MAGRKQAIQESYKQLGGSFSSFYDNIITYSSPAGKLMNRIIWGFNEETTAEWMNGAMAGIPENFRGRLLEVPVGTGVLTMPLYKRLPQAQIVCLDYSAEMMQNAEKRAQAMNIENVQFQQGDVGTLSFADETFDIVLSLNGFHAFPDKPAAYAETYRVLKKGGIFCGCFYIQGEKKRTDWFCKHLLTPKGSFTPPYETKQTLIKRLESLYEKIDVKTVNAEGIFRCMK